jgi:hypothetical protein
VKLCTNIPTQKYECIVTVQTSDKHKHSCSPDIQEVDKIKEDEVGGACGTGEEFTWFWLGGPGKT